ncbi:hypothetical protein BDA99DRAFT_536270 [Phascolomyces articulosus]|uniref:Uncharacterized protein n=1 Tax=Phascolomyces articulosus TaxID=60185 RepID=A0AAD5K356_9FUNG|nr:hypothetical protein BDA99DRAFT_536270 [Phascolomyces articulosus]
MENVLPRMHPGDKACCPFDNGDCSAFVDKTHNIKLKINFIGAGVKNHDYNIAYCPAGGYVFVSGNPDKPKFEVFDANKQNHSFDLQVTNTVHGAFYAKKNRKLENKDYMANDKENNDNGSSNNKNGDDSSK